MQSALRTMQSALHTMQTHAREPEVACQGQTSNKHLHVKMVLHGQGHKHRMACWPPGLQSRTSSWKCMRTGGRHLTQTSDSVRMNKEAESCVVPVGQCGAPPYKIRLIAL
eukprot:1151462-Pelagomonas_calceolata.AAC.3